VELYVPSTPRKFTNKKYQNSEKNFKKTIKEQMYNEPLKLEGSYLVPSPIHQGLTRARCIEFIALLKWVII
jgi:hypothetical protein